MSEELSGVFISVGSTDGSETNRIIALACDQAEPCRSPTDYRCQVEGGAKKGEEPREDSPESHILIRNQERMEKISSFKLHYRNCFGTN